MEVPKKMTESELQQLVVSTLAEQREITAIEKYAQQHENLQFPLQQKYYQDLMPLSQPKQGQQYAFEVDLDRCSGCKACVTACHSLNGLGENETWRSVGLLLGGTEEKPIQQHVTTACHHCAEPACMHGCPVNAYEKDEITGIVKHLDDQCIGCVYCTLKCPYEVPQYDKAHGIVRKCDMCADRLSEGEAPACVQACPTQALAIKVVDKEKILEESQATALVPGAPPSDYTLPTTTYNSNQAVPRNMLPSDYHHLNPQHSHPPLIIMLVLTQLSVGAFCVDMLLNTFLNNPVAPYLNPIRSVVALCSGLLALGASVFHLGRPLYAFRVVVGLKKSWLSREVLVFGLFAILAVLYAASFWIGGMKNTHFMLGLGVIMSGMLGVVFSVLVYADCRKELWREFISGFKFFTTVAILGFSTTLITSTASVLFIDSVERKEIFLLSIGPLCLGLTIISALKMLWEASIFRYLKDHSYSIFKRAALLMVGKLNRVTLLRFLTGGLGGLLLPLLVYYASHNIDPNSSDTVLLIGLSIVTFSLTLIGEFCERYLFFTTAVSLKMPGDF